MNGIAFRSIGAADAPAIQAVAAEAWTFTYASIFGPQFIENFVRKNYAPEVTVSLLPRIEAGRTFFHVAETEDRIVGFCHIDIVEQAAELRRIYLLPAYIGKGIGHQLLQQAEAFVAAAGLKSYSCFVHEQNEIGKRFYFRENFTHVAGKDQADEWCMEKTLG